jgi:DNA-binding MarR family transcriptional regulator
VERVVTLSEQGQTQEEIADVVGISQPAVSKILHRMEQRGLAALDVQLASLKMRRLRILEYMSREGRRAWEQSKQGRVRKRQRKAIDASGTEIVVHELLVDEHPDPRMLDQARKAEEALAEVCGFTGRGQGANVREATAADTEMTAGDPLGTAVSMDPTNLRPDQLRDLSLDDLQARVVRLAEALCPEKGGPA